MKYVLISLIVPLFMSSSGGYQPKHNNIKPYNPTHDKKAPSASATPADKSYKYVEADPAPKKEEDLKDLIFKLERKNVTINNFNYLQANFTLKGTYKKESDLTNFLKEIKKRQRSDKEFELKTWHTIFAGSKTLHYEVTAENLF